MGVDSTNPKDRQGIKKAPLGVVPPALGIYASDAYADGATRYGPFNWRVTGVKAMVYVEAMRRHLDAFQDGQNFTEDSGVHHLACIIADCGIILDAEGVGKLIDDRPPPGPAADLLRKRDKTAHAEGA